MVRVFAVVALAAAPTAVPGVLGRLGLAQRPKVGARARWVRAGHVKAAGRGAVRLDITRRARLPGLGCCGACVRAVVGSAAVTRARGFEDRLVADAAKPGGRARWHWATPLVRVAPVQILVARGGLAQDPCSGGGFWCHRLDRDGGFGGGRAPGVARGTQLYQIKATLPHTHYTVLTT